MTAANVEGSYAIATAALRNLSYQQLLDCSTLYPNSGCQGGAFSVALDYIIANAGLNGEDDYPFTQTDDENVVLPCDTVRQARYVGSGETEVPWQVRLTASRHIDRKIKCLTYTQQGRAHLRTFQSFTRM